ncbi:MAG: conjugal transfer protein TraF [Nitrospirota bacterium]
MCEFVKWVGALVLLIVLLPWPVAADELPLFYKGLRPLGMGGAFTAVADDENAMFYNPAGLNQIEGFGGAEVLDPFIEVSKNTLDFIKDLQDVSDANTDAEQTALAADLLDEWLGEHLHLRAGVFPNLTFHNFGIGVLGQAVVDFEVHNPLGSNTLEARGGYDIALVASGAYAFTVRENPLRIGATAKIIQRQLSDQTYTTRQLVEQDGFDPTDDLQTGNGFGLDLGAIYSLPVLLEPSFGVSIQNIADTKLGDAGKLEQQLNLGAVIHPPVGFGKLLVAVDIVDATHQLGKDSDLARRLHAGIEYRLPVVLAIRAGLYQGYPSYGLTADFWFLKLVAAAYTEEIGAYAGQQPDRRYAAQLSLGF